MYDEFLEKYCKKHEVSEEEAKTHAIVKEFLDAKEKIDRNEQISREKV